jgi:hypothetical protein
MNTPVINSMNPSRPLSISTMPAPTMNQPMARPAVEASRPAR